MKKSFKSTLSGFAFLLLLTNVSCDKDEPDDRGPFDSEKYVTQTIGFKDAPQNLFGSSTYGENLYNGEISTGYITRVYENIYAQFPINYGYNYNSEFQLAWCYTLYNGGFALSKYHDMTEANYANQLSVYDETSPSSGNFVVANGSSTTTDPSHAVYSDYAGCARVYLTDTKGYTVEYEGQSQKVSGKNEDAFFASVMMNNTTYSYLTMLNGNDYCTALNAENKGWMKVQFIAFDDDTENGKPLNYVEAYLANYDKNLAGGWMGILNEWIEVDLSPLKECSILVINFVGSDSNEYGLKTPAYCALDNFVIAVEKDK